MTSQTPQDSKSLMSGRLRPITAPTPSPHTPLSRSISSSIYGSPTSNFRIDDENLLVFEIGTRNIRVGFAGESSPRCVQSYSPNQTRRVGDFRQYSPQYNPRNQNKNQVWGEPFQLWGPDIRDQDLNLLGDRLERLLRDLESNQLMLDSRTRKVILVLSSQLPKPLLEITLASVFNAIQCPTITILPTNIMSIVGAGLRSGLVVDIGWSETNVSAIFEYRQVYQKNTIRAAKVLTQAYANLLPSKESDQLTVEEAEDLLIRKGWCRQLKPSDDEKTDKSTDIQIGPTQFKLQYQQLADPPDQLFFGSKPFDDLDDENEYIHELIYSVLMQLPLDVRKVCISRIIITGGVSNLPGIKRRILQELNQLIQNRKWNPIKNYGSAEIRKKPDTINQMNPKGMNHSQNTSESSSSLSNDSIPPHLTNPETDKILDRIISLQRLKNDADPIEPILRIINTMGAWVGASFTGSFRIKGAVEIEKDRFLSMGLVGGAIKKEISTSNQRQSMGVAIKQINQSNHWTLGVWA